MLPICGFLLFCIPALLAKETLTNLPRVDPDKTVTKNGRIIGGQVAATGQYPWQVAIYKDSKDGRFFCGGTILDESWILTAAQCVHEATNFTIQLGSNQLKGTDSNRIAVTTNKFFINDQFDSTVSLAHDIGLIKLEEPLVFNDYVQPIEYFAMYGMLYPGAVLTVTGWGQSSDDNTDLENELLYANVVITSWKTCSTIFGESLTNSMICTSGVTNNEGICFGDIGGPLLSASTIGNSSSVMAIASWFGQDGCESANPKGYTRVDFYRNWIVDVMEKN